MPNAAMELEDRTIYLLPGMTPEYPIFSRLTPLLPESEIVTYLPPRPRESLGSYCVRMAEHMTADAVLVGVSFGGIVALEISRVLKPRGCILISSIRDPRQLPPWFRVLGRIDPRTMSALIEMVGKLASVLPKKLSTRSVLRLRKLYGESGAWHRWATSLVLGWRPKPFDFPIMQIHGDRDYTFPIRYVSADVCIKGAAHSLLVTHPQAAADAVLPFIRVH